MADSTDLVMSGAAGQSVDATSSSARAFLEYWARRKVRRFEGTIDEAGQYPPRPFLRRPRDDARRPVRRYSSDLQNERSAEDQFGALRGVAAARGWQEVAAFADRGISGAALANRPGVQTLLCDAELGQFEVVLVEALDRISRDQEGTAHIFKRLSYRGVALETLSEGRISELHVGLNGTMNQLFLAELANTATMPPGLRPRR